MPFACLVRGPCAPSTSEAPVAARRPCSRPSSRPPPPAALRSRASSPTRDRVDLRRGVMARGALADSLPGFTPWEFVIFDESVMEHTGEIEIQAPPSQLYEMLMDRVLVTRCLSIYDEHYVYVEDSDVCDYCFYYRWNKLPALQIMFTEHRYDKVPGKGVKFVSLVGMPIVGEFELTEAGGGATRLAVQIKYQMPTLLKQYVGAMPVWGHVNDMFEETLGKFKELAENGGK